MALRCLMALRNSESRSGPMKFAPAVDRSSRSFRRFETSDFRRLGSTPVLDWYSLSTLTCRSSSLSTSLRESPRAVMARISSRLDTAARELQALSSSRGRWPACRGIPGAERSACARSAAAHTPRAPIAAPRRDAVRGMSSSPYSDPIEGRMVNLGFQAASGGKLEIALVQAIDGLSQFGDGARILEHIVRRLQADRCARPAPRGWRAPPRRSRSRGSSGAAAAATHPRRRPGCGPPGRGRRRPRRAAGSTARGKAPPRRDACCSMCGADQRVEDGLELPALLGICEDERCGARGDRARRPAVSTPAPKRCDHRGESRLARARRRRARNRRR